MSVHQFRRPTPPRRSPVTPGVAAAIGVVAGALAAMLLGSFLGDLSTFAGLVVAFLCYRALGGVR
jgi:hypothetical protein